MSQPSVGQSRNMNSSTNLAKMHSANEGEREPQGQLHVNMDELNMAAGADSMRELQEIGALQSNGTMSLS